MLGYRSELRACQVSTAARGEAESSNLELTLCFGSSYEGCINAGGFSWRIYWIYEDQDVGTVNQRRHNGSVGTLARTDKAVS